MIPLFRPFIAPPEEMMPAIKETLYSGYISEGPRVAEFEQAFGEFIHSKNVLALSSGTAALHVALLLAGVGPGDEVISTPMTAEPTNMAIKYTGADIVWADVHPLNGNMDLYDAVSKMTERTKAIVPVHYGGIPVEANDAVWDIVEMGVPVIEDAAHAMGAKRYKLPLNKPYTMYSLQAIKHLTTCDGGMLVVPEEKMAEARKLRWFGIDRQAKRTEVNVERVGYKYNMHDLTATIGLVQMKHAQWIVDRHIENGLYFDKALADVPGLSPAYIPYGSESSYWFYTVLAEDRDGLSRKLTEAGIANGQVHRRNDWHPVFADSRQDLPGLDDFWSKMLHLPCGWWVEGGDCRHIADTIKAGW